MAAQYALLLSRPARAAKRLELVDADQAMLDRVAHHRGGRAQVELLLQVVAMDLSGFGADPEVRGDFLAGRAIADKADNLALAPGEPGAGRGGTRIAHPAQYRGRDR